MIVFFDEFETIARERSKDDTKNYEASVLNILLTELNDIKKQAYSKYIYVIFATNNISKLDEAFKSRISKTIEIPLPTPIERKKIFDNLFDKYYKKFKGDDNHDHGGDSKLMADVTGINKIF